MSNGESKKVAHVSGMSIGFENGARVQTINDHPADHMSEGICEKCGQVNLKCGHCGSLAVKPMRAPAATRTLDPEKLRLLLLRAYEAKNSKFYFGCILIATGDPAAEGVTMTEYAREWGVTRAAVSKVCVFVCTLLGIEPSAYMKSAASKESFRQSNRRPIKRK